MKTFLLSNFCMFLLCFLSPNHFPWLLSLSVFIFFALFPFIFNFWLLPRGFAWRKTLANHPKLRGPIGWPLLGNITLMGPLAHRKLSALSTSLNATRLMGFSLGTTRVIISSDPHTANEILYGQSFSDRPIKISAKVLLFERAIGFAPSGEYWRSLRRMAATHMFSPRRIACLGGVRGRVVEEMVVGVWREMEERGVVELREILQMGSLSSVVESVFGKCLPSEREELRLMVKEGYELIGRFNWEDYFPLGFLDFYGVKRKCHKLATRVKILVAQIIRERRNEGELEGRNDFLSVLLSLPEEERLCDSDMVAVLWEMIFRGTDTVAFLLEWIMARIVLHPDIQAKAQQELDACIGVHRQVEDSDIPKLAYLQAIVKEVLRMHPPGPLLSWARLAVHDVHVDKYFIPAGTTAMVNMWAITHDASIWKEPWVFRPERFIEENVSVMGSDLRLAPFGAGRRVCPGKALGLTTVHLWLARFLHQYTWCTARSVDLSERLHLSLEMKKPLACKVFQRFDVNKLVCDPCFHRDSNPSGGSKNCK